VKRYVFAVFSYLIAVVTCSGWLLAQQSNVSRTTSVDINGNSVPEGPTISQVRSPNGSATTVTTQSINGVSVPLERVDERILRNDARGKVTERITRRYDPQGNPLPPVKETIDEEKHPDGSSTIQSTTSRGDINGDMQIVERSVTDTQKNSSGETSERTVERLTADGLRPVEKQSEVVSKRSNGYDAETTTYRSDGNGGFHTSVRQTVSHTEQGPESSENSAEYEIGPNGELELHGQTVTKTVTRPDGSKDAVVDLYSRDVPGTVNGNESGLKLQEEQLIESAPGPDHTVVQTLSVRRPMVSDPGTLGAARQLSQTVCKGDCKPPEKP